MKNKVKCNIYEAKKKLLGALLLWMSITTILQALKCPKMTQTELFLHIPKSFICDWVNCI